MHLRIALAFAVAITGCTPGVDDAPVDGAVDGGSVDAGPGVDGGDGQSPGRGDGRAEPQARADGRPAAAPDAAAVNEDGGTIDAPPDAALPDAGDAVDAALPDAGEAGDAALPDEGDAVDVGAGAADAGAADAGVADAGPAAPGAAHEPGGPLAPDDLALPAELDVELATYDDVDCYRFGAPTRGRFTASAFRPDGSACTYEDPDLTIMPEGGSGSGDGIATTDGVFFASGGCPTLDVELDPGAYVLCVGSLRAFGGIANPDSHVRASFKGYVCGDDVVDPGEECDGAARCGAACVFEDGVPREDETAGNDAPGGAGVHALELDLPARGAVDETDVDWWRIQLPGNRRPGALRIAQGDADVGGASCGTALDVTVEVFSVDDRGEPLATSAPAAPCHAVVVSTLHGDPLYGDETLLVRVRSGGAPSPYHLVATWIEGICGNGVMEPSEECEPEDDATAPYCEPFLCRWAPPPNDACATATILALDPAGAVTGIAGSLATAVDQHPVSCNGDDVAHDADVFFRFDAPRDGRVSFDLAPRGFRAAVSLFDDDGCALAGERGCAAGTDAAPATSLTLDVVAQGRYVVVVDALSGPPGGFDLFGRYSDATVGHEVCSAALPLDPDALSAGSVNEAGDLRSSGAHDAATVVCAGSTGPRREHFYRFAAPQSGRVRFALQTSGWEGQLGLTSGACAAGALCAGGGTEVLADVEAGDDVLLVVAGAPETSATFVLSGGYAAVPVNDRCDAATRLALAADGTATVVTGNTQAANDDGAALTAACAAEPGDAGRDVFFVLEPAVTGFVSVALDARFDAAIYTREGCAAAADASCTPHAGAFAIPVVAGQPVTLILDGQRGGGAFTLTVKTLLEKLGETCRAAQPLSGRAGSLDGDNVGYANDLDPNDVGECTGFAARGPDIVYSIELGAGETLEATQAFAGGQDGSLYLLDACPPTATSCVAGTDAFGMERLTYTNPGPAQTLFLVVDQYGSAPGPFHLTWEVR